MSPIIFSLFQICGIFPFEITTQKQIFYSKFWHFWSVFLHLSVIILSIIELFIYWQLPDNVGYIYKSLLKFEPYPALIRVILQSASVLFRSIFGMLKIYVESIVKASTSETNKVAHKATLLVLIFIFTLNILVYSIFKSRLNNWSSLLNFSISVIQSAYGLIHFLYCYISLHTINYNLNEIETKIQRLRSRHNYYKILCRKRILEEIDENIKVYNYFSEIFYFLIKIIIFEAFYESLLGIKQAEDLLYSEQLKNFVVPGICLVIYHLYAVPMLFLVIHQGHSIQAKVLY